ncbi:hypothetical protein MASR2M78_33600 [Treponema sp.]
MAGRIKPLAMVPVMYNKERFVRESLVICKRGSVNALKPAVCPGKLMIIPREARGTKNQP